MLTMIQRFIRGAIIVKNQKRRAKWAVKQQIFAQNPYLDDWKDLYLTYMAAAALSLLLVSWAGVVIPDGRIRVVFRVGFGLLTVFYGVNWIRGLVRFRRKMKELLRDWS